MLHSHDNQSRLTMKKGWIRNLMMTLVYAYSKRVSVRDNLLHSVHLAYFASIAPLVLVNCIISSQLSIVKLNS